MHTETPPHHRICLGDGHIKEFTIYLPIAIHYLGIRIMIAKLLPRELPRELCNLITKSPQRSNCSKVGTY